MRRILNFLVILLVPASLSAQSKLFQEMKQKYPNEPWVYTERSKYLTITAQGDSLVSTGVVKESVLSLQDQQTSGMWRIYGSDFQEISDLHGKLTRVEKGKTKEIDLPTPPRRHEDDNSVFFDDSYFYQLNFPVRKEGNRESWNYKESYKDPKLFPAFYFYGYRPIDESIFSISVSPGIDLAWEVYNDPTHAIVFKKYNKGAYTTFEWSVHNFSAPHSEENSPKMAFYIPHVVFYIKSFVTSKGVTKNVLAGVDDLYREYLGNINGLNEKFSPELDSLVRTLVNKSDAEIEKVRKIFYWVQDHIHYIAFEDGMRGFVPHHPNYIFEKRYGDCKDMASLLVALLKIAGVDAHHTLIGTRDIPYRYSALPTSQVDNHMIATYIDGDKNYYFLDATGNYTRLGLPSAMIQGKEALIISPASYEIKNVPVIDADRNYFRDSVTVTIQKRALYGKAKTFLDGYEKINASYSVDKAIPVETKNGLVELLKKGHNKFYLDTFKISQLHERDLPLRIDYDFHVSDYVTELGNEIYVNLNLAKSYYNDLIPAERKLPIEYDHQLIVDECYTMPLPDGYQVSYLPPNASFTSKTLDFRVQYSTNGNKVFLQTTVKKHILMLTPDLFADWNNAIGQLNKVYQETIIFKKSK